MTTDNLNALLCRLETAAGPDEDLDKDVMKAFFRHWLITWEPTGDLSDEEVQALVASRTGGKLGLPITESLDAATEFVRTALPGFYQSSGLCYLTGHASIGPDYNGPDGERLRREWPEERFHEGFHADLKPGDGRHRQCLALLHTAVQALAAKAEAYESDCVQVEQRIAARREEMKLQLLAGKVSHDPS